MAFTSPLRRILIGPSSSSLTVRSQFASIHLNATLHTPTVPKLFVSGLSRNTTDEKLYYAFARFGRFVHAKVIVDRDSGRSKGFGFVTYETVKEADKAREEMNGKCLDGCVIFVDPAKPREAQPCTDPFTINKTVGWSSF